LLILRARTLDRPNVPFNRSKRRFVMQIFISFLMMFLILILPMQVSASFVAYRIAKTYIVVGMDSYSGFNPSDQTCRVAVLRDTHIFAYEEIDISAPQVRLANIAKELVNMN